MIAIDLNEQQIFDAHPKAIQQTNFKRYLNGGGKTAMFFVIEGKKETVLDF